MELTGLPNIGTVLAENLRRVGITSAEELRAAGACEAWLRIRAQVDPGACFHQLTAANFPVPTAAWSRRRCL